MPRQAGLSGPTLVRLLARLTEADVHQPDRSLSIQLSQWLGWADAIALSTALKAAPAGAPAPATASGTAHPAASPVADPAAALARTCADARAALVRAIVDDGASASRRRGPSRPAADTMDAQIDFAIYRQRYGFVQQQMESTIGQLRANVRAALSGRSAAMAKLATVDAVMERVLGAREQALLGGVPTLLALHFERLRQDAAARAAPPGTPAAPQGAWLKTFRQDMHSVLRAELDIRFQPVEGLLAALGDS